MSKEKNKTYLVFDHEGVHEYNIIVEKSSEGTRYSIFASNGSSWFDHIKGNLLFSMLDHGDGIKFDKKLKNIEYDVAFYLRFLLDLDLFLDTNEVNKKKHKVVEFDNIIEL